ncbi:MAG: hypothetical protein U0V70_14080 [Terriglobia bacterium]
MGIRMNNITRRQLLTLPSLSALSLLSGSVSKTATKAPESPFLKEYGFWDYTTPGAGGMEAFQKGDYVALLDDMAQAGMNSLMIFVKWLTTGYRSRLEFLDQTPGNVNIASDNQMVRFVIDEARRRKIKVWLGAVATYYDVERFRSKPYRVLTRMSGFSLPFQVGIFDTDNPEVANRAVQMFEEIVEQFPGISGLCVELEGAGVEVEQRIPLYEAWAKEKGRPPFAQLGHPFDPRTFDVAPWRDYTTYSRLKLLRSIEAAVRTKGFHGEMAMICETGRKTYMAGQEVDLKEYHAQFPDWAGVTYEYEKWDHRYAMMDFCLDQPKRSGLKVFYLPRGVMTWGMPWPLPISLEQSWTYDTEDILQFKPDGVWWFGCGTVNEGAHVSLKRLQQVGFGDPVSARRALLNKTQRLTGSA